MHGYFSDAWPDRLDKLRDITQMNVRQVSPDAKIWMSEFCILGDTGQDRSFSGLGYESNDMEFAIHLAKVMHRDLTRLNVSAWHWWLAITPHDYKDGLLKVSPSLESESIETTKAFWIFGNYSRFIRPGFTRIEINNPDEWSGLMASAYKSPDNRKIVLVVVNGDINKKSISIRLAESDLRIDRDSIELSQPTKIMTIMFRCHQANWIYLHDPLQPWWRRLYKTKPDSGVKNFDQVTVGRLQERLERERREY